MTEIYIAIGTSLLGFLASSAIVVIKSNPIYPKNRIVAPSMTPAMPLSSIMNGVKLLDSKLANDTTTMKRRIANFPDVTMLLNFSAVSLPLVVIQVQASRNIAANGDALILP